MKALSTISISDLPLSTFHQTSQHNKLRIIQTCLMSAQLLSVFRHFLKTFVFRQLGAHIWTY